MATSRPNKSIFARLFGKFWTRPDSDFTPHRGQQTHVIILDGTMSSLTAGYESNAGLTYKLLREMGAALSIYYEPGPQWHDWRSALDVAAGRGINRQIRRAYGYLASRYRPGDQIILMGYSRGAYAVRSLAGVIDMVGLLRAEDATERNVRQTYRHYRHGPSSPAARAFASAHCYPQVEIEMIGVWDTVKSLGFNAPILWRLSTAEHAFHTHALGESVRNGFQALAIDENRVVYSPVLWTSPEGFEGYIDQVWFPGSHSDVGGHLNGFSEARGLSNIPLVWMLKQANACGVPLPEEWQMRFPIDATAPSVGRWRGFAKLFLSRRKRIVGADPSERIDASVDVRRGSAENPTPQVHASSAE